MPENRNCFNEFPAETEKDKNSFILSLINCVKQQACFKCPVKEIEREHRIHEFFDFKECNYKEMLYKSLKVIDDQENKIKALKSILKDFYEDFHGEFPSETEKIKKIL